MRRLATSTIRSTLLATRLSSLTRPCSPRKITGGMPLSESSQQGDRKSVGADRTHRIRFGEWQGVEGGTIDFVDKLGAGRFLSLSLFFF